MNNQEKKKLFEAILPKVVKKLSELNILKENELDIVSDLKQKNETLGNHLKGNDEIGEFYIIKSPDEKSTPENIVLKTNLSDLLLKQKNGELSLENIRYIVKKEGTAMRNANKIIKDYSKELYGARKQQLESLINKRDGINKQLEGYLLIKKDKQLDEESNRKIEHIKERIAQYDNQIVELQQKIKQK